MLLNDTTAERTVSLILRVVHNTTGTEEVACGKG